MPVGEPKEPVAGFPLKFSWLGGDWERIFDEQIRLIRTDVQRARLDNKIIVYLSCPISARGGGHSGTNVEIAKFTERRLLREWGERFWVLNPAQYQLESKEGYGLLDMHAKTLKIDLAELLKREAPGGGDYMRMWTKILVEDSLNGSLLPAPKPRNLGSFFDAYYFLGPTDVRVFFGADSSNSLGASIEEYFARKHSFDRAFRESFTAEGRTSEAEKVQADAKRRAFLVYYSLRAGAAVSLGSHDEWAIFTLLNQARRKVPETEGGGISNQLVGLFDGRPLPLSTGEASASLGYGTLG